MTERLSSSVSFDKLVDNEEFVCKWFDHKKGYGLFKGIESSKDVVVHRKSMLITRRERSRMKRGAVLKKQEWEVL
jgi:cold shock CspA family protein